MRATGFIGLCATITAISIGLAASAGQGLPLTSASSAPRISKSADVAFCELIPQIEYIWGKQEADAPFTGAAVRAATVGPRAELRSRDYLEPPRPPYRLLPFSATPSMTSSWVWIIPIIPFITQPWVPVLIGLIIIWIWKCWKYKNYRSSELKAISSSTKPPQFPKIRVTFGVNNRPLMVKQLSPVASSDRVSYTLDLKSESLKSGDSIRLFAMQTLDDKGSPVEDVWPPAGSAPIEMVVPDSLFSSAVAVSRSSRYMTAVSSQLAQTDPSVTSCLGPYEFRIQQRRRIRHRSKGKTTVRITWTNLPKTYVTNKQTGTLYYRIVNLKKGTYRSLVFGKCGLVGGMTGQVTLKR